MRKTFLALPLLALCLAACSNVDQGIDENIVKQGAKSPKSLLSLLNEFQSETKKSTRVNSANGIVIDECENKSYYVKTGASAKTRSATTVSDSTEIVLSYIKFHQDTVKGFAIASNDPRLNRVYAFVERGDLADTAKIEPLKWAIEKIPYIAEADVMAASIDSMPPPLPIDPSMLYSRITIDNILNTKWHQEEPYNNYCPKCTCGQHKHMFVGCVPLATAQLIAKCKRFTGTYMGNGNIDFDKLTSTSQISTGSSLATQVATFIHEVAMYCQVHFSCSGSSSDIRDAFLYLKDLGYEGHESQGNLVPETVYKNLQAGIPHITQGVQSDTNIGHAWLVTGITGTIKKSTQIFCDYKLYCNWGWGGYCDGWFADYRIPNSETSYTVRNRQVYITNY